MAIVSCPECGKQVSTSAKTCPHCGAPGPVAIKAIKAKGSARKGCGFISLLLVAVFGVILYQAYQSDETWNAAHPGKVQDENGNAVDPSTIFNIAKPIFIRAGAPLCPTEKELSAERSHAANDCIIIPDDASVLWESSSGIMDRTYEVRLKNTSTVFEGWTTESWLRN